MSFFYCPNCGAHLNDQKGFDPEAGYWHCSQCGQFLTDGVGTERFEGVGWFCDNCGAYLNKQIGFNDWLSSWVCQECGFENQIADDQVYESEESYKNYGSEESDCDEINEEYNDEDDDEDDYEDDSEETDSTEDFQTFTTDVLEKIRMLAQIQQAKEKEQARRLRKQQRVRLWRKLTRQKTAVGLSSYQFQGIDYKRVIDYFEKCEFYHIKTKRIEDLPYERIKEDGIVENVLINGKSNFDSASQFSFDAKVVIVYRSLKRIKVPMTAITACGQNFEKVASKFTDAGFIDVRIEPIYDLIKGWQKKMDQLKV